MHNTHNLSRFLPEDIYKTKTLLTYTVGTTSLVQTMHNTHNFSRFLPANIYSCDYLSCNALIVNFLVLLGYVGKGFQQ
jgi:hypothetical protein